MRPAPTPGTSTTGSMPRSTQRGAWPDARPHEDRRRADRAGCEGDAPPEDPFSLCTGLHFDPDGLVVLDANAADEALRPDGEVGPLPGGEQVGDRGGKPQAVSPVLWEGADAGCLWMVVVGHLGEAEASADVEEGALRRNQFVSAPATDRDRATTPVELTGAFTVVFQATKVR